jgi:PAS domain S-box-containing protein
VTPDDSNSQPTDISPLPGSPIEDSHRQELFRIASDPSLTTDEKLERLLSVSATVLDVQNAHIVAIDEDDHEIIATSDPTIATTGAEHDLAETFCQETVTRHQIVTVLGREDVTGISPDFDEIAYYIGSKILVDSELYGTLCFVDTEPRNRDLNAAERSFVDLASRWVSLVLEQARQDRLADRDLDGYQLLVEEVTDYAIVMLDTTGDIKSWNTGAHLLYQYREDEVIGEQVSLFYTAEDRQAYLPDELLGTARQNGRVEREGWRVRKDGSRFWALVTITALYDQKNEVRGFGMITRDLTERKAKREKRERDIEFTEEALDTLNDVFFVLDGSGQIDRINEELAAVSGYSESELISMDPVELFVPEDRERIANAIDTALGSG